MGGKQCRECKSRMSTQDMASGAVLCDSCAHNLEAMFVKMDDATAKSCLNLTSSLCTGIPVSDVSTRTGSKLKAECVNGMWDGREVEFVATDFCRMRYLMIGETDDAPVIELYERRDGTMKLHHVRRCHRVEVRRFARKSGGIMFGVQSLGGDFGEPGDYTDD
jgi:hypothetical protein